MVISLEEAKLFLRVDGDEENTLITNFILTAEEICEGVLRYPLTEFIEVPGPVKQAILFVTAQFYEQRETIDVQALIETVRLLLFAYRKEGW